jgi:hypothetical protein
MPAQGSRTMPNQLSTPTLAALVTLTAEGRVAYRGLESLALTRLIVHELVHVAGYEFVYDPSSAPDLLDVLAVAGVSTSSGATLGGGIGLLIGLIFRAPVQGALVGAALGAAAGAYRGSVAIQSGLRLRACWIAPGVPEMIMEVR